MTTPDTIIDGQHVDLKTGALPARDHNLPPEISVLPMLPDAAGLKLKFGDEDVPGLYTPLMESVRSVLLNIRETAPEIVETDRDNGIIAAHMNKLRDTIKTCNNHREAEKAAYLAAGGFVQQYFAALTDRLEKARDILQKRGDAFTARKAAEARAEAARLAAEAARKAQEAREAAAKLQREQEEAAAAAARARKAENIAAHQAVAETAAAAQAIAQVDALIAQDQVEDQARIATAPTPNLVRTRHESGDLSTGKTVPHVEIVDKFKLNMALLLPFIKEEEILKALKAWAKTTSHKTMMDGALIEMRDKADYRR